MTAVTTVDGLSAATPSAATGLRCLACGATFPLAPMFEGCPICAAEDDRVNLRVTYDYDAARKTLTPDAVAGRGRRGIWRWAELLPIDQEGARISLGEGDTPLLPVRGRELGEVWVKDESRNPTWSYKDRLCAAAVSYGVQSSAQICAVSSTGNHGAAAAAYAARAGMPCIVFTRPDVPATMKILMQIYGAKVLATTRLGRWALLRAGTDQAGWYPMSNFTMPPTGNPYGVEGFKTIAFELAEQLGWRAPGTVIVPTGYGEGLSGIWHGFEDLQALGLIDSTPRMIAAETATSGSLATALASGASRPVRVETSPSLAFSINAANTTYQALKALRDSGGCSIQVNDDEILDAQGHLGRQGLFAEAASAISLAALISGHAAGMTLPEPVVVIMTSSGLKDPHAAQARLEPVVEVVPEWEALVPLLPPELLPTPSVS